MAEASEWQVWFSTLEDRGGVWVIRNFEPLPDFLKDWQETIVQEESYDEPDAGWRRAAAFLEAHANLQLVEPVQLAHEDRSLYNSQWMTQPPTRIWFAYAFTEDLAIVFRARDCRMYPVGFAARSDLEAGFEELVDESDDIAGIDFEQCLICDECDTPWGEGDYDNRPEDVLPSPFDEEHVRPLCVKCRDAVAQQCEGCGRYILLTNPADGSANLQQYDDCDFCLACVRESEGGKADAAME